MDLTTLTRFELFLFWSVHDGCYDVTLLISIAVLNLALIFMIVSLCLAAVQLMRPGFGCNVSCTVGDFAIGLPSFMQGDMVH